MGILRVRAQIHKPAWRRALSALALGLFCLALGACARMGIDLQAERLWSSPTLKDPEVSQEHHGDIVARVAPGQAVGQSFVSRRPRLNGVEVWLGLGADADPAGGVLLAELYHAPGETQPLASLPITFQTIQDNSSIWIAIPPRDDPPNQAYYLVFKSSAGSVLVMGRQEDAYAAGELYIDGVPREADIGFRSGYQYGLQAVLSDLRAWAGDLWLALPLLLALWLPGALALELLAPGRESDWGQRTALAVGLSLALIPLLMLWTSVLGLRWSRPAVLAGSALLAALYLWRLWRRGALRPGKWRLDWASLALAGIFALSLGARLAMVRDLAAPAWVDSVHHGALTRLILEHGRFPDSYAPYLDLQHASYHIGFHSGLAAFQWLSGLDLLDGMLLYGQALNASSVFAAYLLTVTLTRSRTAGLAAALITGLFSPMPAYFTSWGRYTQLAGQVILPAAAALAVRPWPRIERALDYGERHARPGWLLGASIACAGLLLTHYRVAAFLAILLLAHWFITSEQALWKGALRRIAAPALGWMVAAGAIAGLLTLPWWPATITGLLAPFSSLAGNATQRPPFFEGFAWNLLTPAYGRGVIALAAFGLALAIVLRRWFWPTIILWVAGMFALANLGALGFPALNFVNNLAVEIALYLPLAVLGGFFSGWALEALAKSLPQRLRTPYWAAAALAGAVLALYGARALVPILNPVTLLFRAADEPAIDWVAGNLPPGETVLVNPFHWGYGLYAGQDGGYWITPLAGRATLPPPVLYGMANTPEKIREINEIIERTLELNGDPQALHDFLRGAGIRYIFIGARGGALSAQELRYSAAFRVLYARDGAWVFEVR